MPFACSVHRIDAFYVVIYSYSALIRGCAYAPEMEETMFNYATLGFAFVETFAFILIGAALAVLVL